MHKSLFLGMNSQISFLGDEFGVFLDGHVSLSLSRTLEWRSHRIRLCSHKTQFNFHCSFLGARNRIEFTPVSVVWIHTHRSHSWGTITLFALQVRKTISGSFVCCVLFLFAYSVKVLWPPVLNDKYASMYDDLPNFTLSPFACQSTCVTHVLNRLSQCKSWPFLVLAFQVWRISIVFLKKVVCCLRKRTKTQSRVFSLCVSRFGVIALPSHSVHLFSFSPPPLALIKIWKAVVHVKCDMQEI